jgi:ribosomal protein L7/L12
MKLEIANHSYDSKIDITLTDVSVTNAKIVISGLTDKILGIEKPVHVCPAASTMIECANQSAETHDNWKRIINWYVTEKNMQGCYDKIQTIKFIRYSVPGMGLKEAKDLVEYTLGDAPRPAWFKLSDTF